jgi:hypothetical protein
VTVPPTTDEKPAAIIKLLPGTLLAFDFGVKRIGVAVGNSIAHSTQPLITLHGEQNETRFAAIADKRMATRGPDCGPAVQ